MAFLIWNEKNVYLLFSALMAGPLFGSSLLFVFFKVDSKELELSCL